MNVTKPTGIQHRTLRGTQLRAESQGDEMALVGYAASFNCLSQDLGGFREMIAPGAFKRSLQAGADVKALFNHDPSKILGRTGVNLTLEEDSYGLKFRCVLNKDSALAQEVHGLIKNGLIDQCSFAFTCPEKGGDTWGEVDQNAIFDGSDDTWDLDATEENSRKAKRSGGGMFVRRTLLDVNLLDVSAVTYPAYNVGTAVAARSADYTSRAVADAAYRATMLKKLDAAMKSPTASWAELKAKADRLAKSL